MVTQRTINRLLLLLLLSIISPSLVCSVSNKQSGFCSSEEDVLDSYQNQMATTLGGLHNPSSAGAESNSTENDSLARFAVQEHNKNQNEPLEFVRVVKAQEQVVAGTLHHLTLEAVLDGKNKLYEAKVWVKPWMNFKELQEFKHTGEVTTSTTSDIGVENDGACAGWELVAVNDPLVKDAADHVVMTLQHRSNSLYPYVLKEVVHAKTQVVEEISKLEMLVKVQRGAKEEKFNVEVHKDHSGVFHLNKMVQDDS